MAFNNDKNNIESTMNAAWQAFGDYSQTPVVRRADLLRAIALEIDLLGDELLQTCMRESNLPEKRLQNERARTIFQLNSYASAIEAGNLFEVCIDTGDIQRIPAKPDIRKMQVPLGPVVVFGASNFPFAFSTAGGDTASALAAGCPVIVKAHPAHLQTSELMAGAIHTAVKKSGLPAGIFSHISGEGFEMGRALVSHPYTKAVGFTGSFNGGKAIWELANSRKEPIPVFAEMSSINPVFLLPEKLEAEAIHLASQLAASITMGSGQFCTNPGVIIALQGPALDAFVLALSAEIHKTAPSVMLHEGIANSYRLNRNKLIAQPEVSLLAESDLAALPLQDIPSIASASAAAFLANPVLHQEVFGSFSLVVRCRDKAEMLDLAKQLEGQLTITVMADKEELADHHELLEEIKKHCGRLIVNNVPTGVEVCLSMQHGGPWPSATDSRSTSIGADAIRRFLRPLSFQNYPETLLPAALRNNNPLGIWRTVNNQLTKDPLAL